MTLVRLIACKTWHKRVAPSLLVYLLPASISHGPGASYTLLNDGRRPRSAADVWIFSSIRLDCRLPTSLNVPAGV